ncbi:MAG: DUF4129 domain-containing protein [Planctomycetota bacterium]|nr:DUF4129 domain-containing protein [Planctomycetota bacterium]
MVKLHNLLCAFAFALCSFSLVTIQSSVGAYTQQDTPSRTVDSQITDKDRAIIGRSTHSVWFDANDGTVRPIRSGTSVDVDDRHDAIASNLPNTPPSWWVSLKNLVAGFFGLLFQSWQILLLVALITLLVIAGIVILRHGLSFQSSGGKMSNVSMLEREKAKLLDLPFEVEQTMFGLLGQAEKYRAAGDYSKAIIYLFSHALVEMDGARCIRLARGKTNRAYLRELRDQESLRGFTNQLVTAFEYAFFGKHVLSQQAFERIWQQVPAFETNVKQISMKPSKDSRSLSMGNS